MRKFILKIILLILIAINISGCKDNNYERSEISMSTVLTLKANNKAAIDESFLKVADIENKIKNDIQNLEAAAGSDKFVKISSEVFTMLKTANEYSILTDGAFDVTTGAAIELWNIKEAKVPTDEEIENVKSLVGFRHIQLRDFDCSAKIDLSGIKINLGGIAKGYAVDSIREIFDKYGVHDGLIDFGTSTIYAFGKKRIGLKHPRKENEIMEIIEIEDAAISTSGDYLKYFIVDGQRYHHIIDPKTCKPVDNGTHSVSVIVNGKVENCAMIADILSTAIFVLGREYDKIKFPENYKIYEDCI